MKMKQSLLALGNRSESGATAEGTHLLGSERQMHEGNGKTELPPSAQIGIPAKPRILIVTDDDSISIRLKVILRREGLFLNAPGAWRQLVNRRGRVGSPSW
ncbi:MAG: hypothetical protein WCE52_15830 [Candidatus Acidiferrum sp.]